MCTQSTIEKAIIVPIELNVECGWRTKLGGDDAEFARRVHAADHAKRVSFTIYALSALLLRCKTSRQTMCLLRQCFSGVDMSLLNTIFVSFMPNTP